MIEALVTNKTRSGMIRVQSSISICLCFAPKRFIVTPDKVQPYFAMADSLIHAGL